MPVRVAARIFSRSFIESFAIASRLPDSTVLKGSTFASSGFALTTAGTHSRQYMTCEYIGCSTHRVPPWSKVAIRASGGTTVGLDWSVVVSTKLTIAHLAGLSFHEGSGSVRERLCTDCQQSDEREKVPTSVTKCCVSQGGSLIDVDGRTCH